MVRATSVVLSSLAMRWSYRISNLDCLSCCVRRCSSCNGSSSGDNMSKYLSSVLLCFGQVSPLARYQDRSKNHQSKVIEISTRVYRLTVVASKCIRERFSRWPKCTPDSSHWWTIFGKVHLNCLFGLHQLKPRLAFTLFKYTFDPPRTNGESFFHAGSLPRQRIVHCSA